ncbi:ATP-binding protein [Paraburkholderia sp. BR14374]|uniref:ATP-binding protein n=1 Tax=Paraburkholderia sp. BR14374 TaxID=3237007 RepID=UPI0034CE848A
MDALTSLAVDHLLLRLQPLNRALRSAVEQQKWVASREVSPDVTALCVTEHQVNALLDTVESREIGFMAGGPSVLSSAEQHAEDELRARMTALGARPPLDELRQTLDLTAFEMDAVLLCLAPEIDRAYERIYAFILDDLNRRYPCLELLVSLTAESRHACIERRPALSRASRLRRCGILAPLGDPPTESRQEFRLGPGVFDFLTGAGPGMSNLFCDRLDVRIPTGAVPSPQITDTEFTRLSNFLIEGRIRVLGISGPGQHGGADLALALAAAIKRPLRRIERPDAGRARLEALYLVQEQIRVAACLGSALWFEANSGDNPSDKAGSDVLAEAFADSPVPILVTGENPWRPEQLIRAGGYAEVALAEPTFRLRELDWSKHFPELSQQDIEDLASRYRLSGRDIESVSSVARTHARLAGNGVADPVARHVPAACTIVTRRSSSCFATVVHPRRSADDLILPKQLHSQIIEIATFFRLQSRVDDDWGFGRLVNGTGMKALFTGDPGTGKTLAAEVIAGLLGLPLCKVDLARIVSKWVGETEKNLEEAFREAEDSHSVLFFDEAEALFGKRGEVQHGTDRYANLEVSYLLQRLESSRGLVILASNMKDQIDSAFVRRFQVVMHFPRPGLPERRCIWQRAFPKSAPLNADLDLQALARLEMTGAAIVSSARTAALLAADSSSDTITMAHAVRATARQFRRDARVLTPSELGPYGTLLQDAS